MTRYVIRRKADGLYWLGRTAANIGTAWTGSPRLAYGFEFSTVACAALLFEIDEPFDAVDILPVEAAA